MKSWSVLSSFLLVSNLIMEKIRNCHEREREGENPNLCETTDANFSGRKIYDWNFSSLAVTGQRVSCVKFMVYF